MVRYWSTTIPRRGRKISNSTRGRQVSERTAPKGEREKWLSTIFTLRVSANALTTSLLMKGERTQFISIFGNPRFQGVCERSHGVNALTAMLLMAERFPESNSLATQTMKGEISSSFNVRHENSQP